MNRRDSARIAAIKAREAAETYGWTRAAHGRLGGRLRRLLPLRRRPAGGGRGRRHGGDPAGRLDPRRRSDRRRRRGRPGDGLHRDAPLPALMRAAASGMTGEPSSRRALALGSGRLSSSMSALRIRNSSRSSGPKPLSTAPPRRQRGSPGCRTAARPIRAAGSRQLADQRRRPPPPRSAASASRTPARRGCGRAAAT